jgi:hypothetical protein
MRIKMADALIKGMKAVASLAGPTSYVHSVAFSPDGQHIVSGSGDKLVKPGVVSWLARTVCKPFHSVAASVQTVGNI